MVKITSKDIGDKIDMSVEISGKGLEIVEEVFAIIMDLPRELRKASPSLYHAFMYKIAAEAQDLNLEEEEDGDGLN